MSTTQLSKLYPKIEFVLSEGGSPSCLWRFPVPLSSPVTHRFVSYPVTISSGTRLHGQIRHSRRRAAAGHGAHQRREERCASLHGRGLAHGPARHSRKHSASA